MVFSHFLNKQERNKVTIIMDRWVFCLPKKGLMLQITCPLYRMGGKITSKRIALTVFTDPSHDKYQ